MTTLVKQITGRFVQAGIGHLPQGARHSGSRRNNPRDNQTFFPAFGVLLLGVQDKPKAAARQFFYSPDASAERIRHRDIFYQSGGGVRFPERTHLDQLPHLPLSQCSIWNFGGRGVSPNPHLRTTASRDCDMAKEPFVTGVVAA